MTNAYQETRVGLIRRVAYAALNARDLNLMAFADDLVTRAHQLAPLAFAETKLRLPHPTDGTQYDKDRLHNRQIVERWVRGEVAKFPHELEEAWVLALSQPWQDQALRELAARYGLLAARAPEAAGSLATLGAATEDFGRFIAAMSPIMADGKVSDHDLAHLKPALERLGCLQGELASLQQQLAKALPVAGETNVTRFRGV